MTTPQQTSDAPTPGTMDHRSTSEVAASLVANGQALIRKELELAKLELQRIAVEKAIALGGAVVGAVFALFVLAFAGVTAARALELVLVPWAAWLVVTGIYTLVVGVALLIAYGMARRSVVPERTRADLRATAAWAKRQVSS